MIKSTYDSVGVFNYKKIKKEKLKMDIEFIRGDTQYIKFQLKDGSGNPIQLEDDEKIYFTLKQNSNSKKVLLQKKFPADISFADGYYQLELSSKDTSKLAYGSYQYDIELKINDFVKTLLMGTITLTEEITFQGDEK